MARIYDACSEGVKKQTWIFCNPEMFSEDVHKIRIDDKLPEQKIDFMITYSLQITLFLNNEFEAHPSNMKIWKNDHVSIWPHSQCIVTTKIR